MATNPLYSANQSPNGATQPTKSVNNQSVPVHRTHNTFDNSYFHNKSQKFGQNEPFFVCEGIPRDRITLHSSHCVRALPFASQFETTLKLNKDYFLVPNQAIQPNTWEYCFKQPSQGDDVIDDAHNLFPLIGDDSSYSLLHVLIEDWVSRVNDSSFDSEFVWRSLIIESLVSCGCLLSNLGYKFAIRFRYNDGKNVIGFDDLFDMIMRNLTFTGHIVTDNVNVYFTTDSTNALRYQKVDNYTALSLLRRFGSYVSLTVTFGNFDGVQISEILGLPDTYNDGLSQYFRMDRICAYQLVNAQYYVNPQVDYIYNAQLFRDNWYTLLREFMVDQFSKTITLDQFFMNGIGVTYDFFSYHYYSIFVSELCYNPTIDWSKAFDLFSYLFGFRESLKFGDYFTDCRTRALAPGTNSVPVTSDGVSIVDMSRNLIMQRFRNAVVKLGNNFEDYLKGIFGSSPSPDYHYPKFIAHNDFVITGTEVNNTSSADQGKIVTNMRSADDTFAFEIDVDMPCIILGISYFSIPRVYSQTKDRFFFHKDRFDMFDPILQYDIDQPVYNVERSDSANKVTSRIFGYQSRFNEYKQRYSIASGAFVTTLPSWVFVTDSVLDPVVDFVVSNFQSPEFIRAMDFEFNRFLQAQPGLSLSTGFHFLITYDNKSPQVRPLEVNPQTI